MDPMTIVVVLALCGGAFCGLAAWFADHKAQHAHERADLLEHALSDVVEDLTLLRLAAHEHDPERFDAPEPDTLAAIMARRAPTQAPAHDA